MAFVELNQSRLNTYAKCERRFYLQYVQDEFVPSRTSVLSPEQEENVGRGDLFHRYIESAMRGLPIEPLLRIAPEPIDEWIKGALEFLSKIPIGPRYVEYTLSIPFQEALLTAKYDLLMPLEDKGVIVDWKTTGLPGISPRWQQDLQQVIFPFVLAEAAPEMGWTQITPDNIEFIHWFAAAPHEPRRFRYSQERHQRNREIMDSFFTRIGGKPRVESSFPKVPDTPQNRDSLCSRCTFMFHCERGVNPKSVRDLSSVFLEADLERIALTNADFDQYEIAY